MRRTAMRRTVLTNLSRLLLVSCFMLFVSQLGFAQQLATGQMPESVWKKFGKYVGNWIVEDRIAGQITASGRLSLQVLAHGEGFEYRYVEDRVSGITVYSIGVIGWDATNKKLVEFNIGNSGSTFSSEFTDDGQGGFSAPISGVGLNQNGQVAPFEGDRAISHSGDQFVVVSLVSFSGEEPQKLISTFTRISDEEAERAATNDFQIYDQYFNGVWGLERLVSEEVTKGLVTISAAPTGNAHLVTVEYENGESLFDLWTYNQRAGSWGAVFNTKFGHGGFSILKPLLVDKIEPGFKTQTSYVGSGSKGDINWGLGKWNIVSEDEYTITLSDLLGDSPDVLLKFRRRTPRGETDGEQAFKNYAALVLGDHWKTNQNGQEIDHAYTQLIPGKFVNFCAIGGPVPAVATIGVDPKTGHCTWWLVNEEHGAGKMIMTQVSDHQWKLTQIEGRIRYEGLSTRVGENTLEQKIIEFSVDGEPVLAPGSVFVWKRQR